MNIFGQEGTTGLQQVIPSMMEVNNYYIIEISSFNDTSGDEEVGYDVIYLMVDSVPGQKKPVKCMRFCSVPKCLTFSQVPGSKFYGPLIMQPSDYRLIKEDEGMSDIIRNAAMRNKNADH